MRKSIFIISTLLILFSFLGLDWADGSGFGYKWIVIGTMYITGCLGIIFNIFHNVEIKK